MLDVSTGVSIGVLALAATAFGWLWIRFDAAIGHERIARELLERDFMAYQRAALEKFATSGSLEKMEIRLTAGIEKMSIRLEVAIVRIDLLSNDLTRLSAGRPIRKPSPREAD